MLFEYITEKFDKDTLIIFVRCCLVASGSDTTYEHIDVLDELYGSYTTDVLDKFNLTLEDYFRVDIYGYEFISENNMLEEMEDYEDEIETDIYNKENYLKYCIDWLDVGSIDELIHNLDEYKENDYEQ